MVLSIDLVFVVLMFWNMISGLGPLSRTEKLVTSGAFYKHAECLTLGTSGDAVTSFQLLYYTQMASVHEVTFQAIRSLRGGRSEIACHALRLLMCTYACKLCFGLGHCFRAC